MSDPKIIENTLYFVAQNRQFESFFADLVRHLAETLDVSYVLVGELLPDEQNIQTLAVYAHGTLTENFVYALDTTPCEMVIGKRLCSYPSQVQALFPQDYLLTKLGAEGYMGIPLWKSNGEPLGILVLMDEKPLINVSLAETLLQIVAIRAAHELERQQAEQVLKLSEARYRTVLEDQTEFIVRWLPDGTRTFVNGAYTRYFNLPAEALIGRSFFSRLPPAVADQIRDGLNTLTPDNPTQTHLFHLTTPDGLFHWEEWSDRGFFDAHGELVEVQSIGRDVTERKCTEEALVYSNRFQSLITTLAIEFINLPSPEVGSVIQRALQSVGEFVGASRCSINMLLDEGQTFCRTHEWYSPDLGESISSMQRIALKCGGAWFTYQQGKQDSVVIPDVHALTETDADLKAYFIGLGIQAFIAVPLYCEAQFIGFIALHFTTPYTSPYLDSILKLLQVTGEIFVNAMERQRSSEEIQQLIRAEETQRQHRVFTEALLDTGAALGSTLRLDVLLETIFNSMQRVVKYDTAQIMEVKDQAFIEIIASRGYPPELVERKPIAISGLKYTRRMLQTHEAYMIPDVRLDPDFTLIIRDDTVVSYLGIPVLRDEQLIAVLVLGSRTPNFFTGMDTHYLKIFAQQVVLAMQNAQFHEEALHLAAWRERQRLARDLHDSVNQTLFSTATMAALVPRLLPKDLEKARAYSLEVEALAASALSEMRTLLIELRPETLIKTELGLLIKQLCATLTGSMDVQVTQVIMDKFVLPEAQQIVFYRIAQEAFNNIIKHAHATQIRVELSKEAERVKLLIQDNGCGFSEAQVPPHHFGLKIMRERAQSIGADLTIRSSAAGTEISLSKELL